MNLSFNRGKAGRNSPLKMDEHKRNPLAKKNENMLGATNAPCPRGQILRWAGKPVQVSPFTREGGTEPCGDMHG